MRPIRLFLLPLGLVAGLGPARAQEITDCDRLAASPFDPVHVGEGISYEALDPLPAIEACVTALQSQPDEARFHFQLGRALIKQGDIDRGLKAYRAAAEREHVLAMHNLGALFDEGKLVPRDRERALNWYLLAAERDFAPSQTALGLAYLNGDGVPQDFAKAQGWLERAALHGDEPALSAMSKLYGLALHGEGPLAAVGAEAAFVWLSAAATQGYPPAMALVALAYDEGKGVAANKAEAIKWYEAAVSAGVESVAERLAALKAAP